MRRFVALFAGLLTGALIGSILALLFAPSSGKNLQEKISDAVDRLAGEVRTAAAERRQELESELEKLRQRQVKLE
ncbi:MAG: YtxH domain-containing protein [Bellilinea sp.]